VPLIATNSLSLGMSCAGRWLLSEEAMYPSSSLRMPTTQLPSESRMSRAPMLMRVSALLSAALVASPPDSMSSSVVPKLTPLAPTSAVPWPERRGSILNEKLGAWQSKATSVSETARLAPPPARAEEFDVTSPSHTRPQRSNGIFIEK